MNAQMPCMGLQVTLTLSSGRSIFETSRGSVPSPRSCVQLRETLEILEDSTIQEKGPQAQMTALLTAKLDKGQRRA